jgi:hypothetical protein
MNRVLHAAPPEFLASIGTTATIVPLDCPFPGVTPCQGRCQCGGCRVSGRSGIVVDVNSDERAQESMMHTFDTPAPVRVVLAVPAGRVRFAATDRADTGVEVRPADPAKTRDVHSAEHTAVTYADGVLHIQTGEPKSALLGHGAVEVTVQLPTGSYVQARTEACGLLATGRLGDVAFDGAYREISIEEAASVRLTAVDGDVEVGRLTGPAQISTARGDIRITEAVRGALELRTQMGSITVGAAAGVSAALDAGTTHGRVSNSLKNTGTTELDIRATTSHGDITARSL